VIITSIFILALLLVNPIRTILSFRKIEGFPAYEMRYYGSYQKYYHFLPQPLKGNRGKRSLVLLENFRESQACSIFAATKGNDKYMGRNRDISNPSTGLFLYTDSKDKYASITLVDLVQMGILEGDSPQDENISFLKSIDLLLTPLLPTEGMNEKGVAIAKADVPEFVNIVEPEKQTVYFRTVMRAVLDNASSTLEAIEIIQNLNTHFSGGGGHFLIADKTGDSAVIEFTDKGIVVLEKNNSYQIITNFLLSKYGDRIEDPNFRNYDDIGSPGNRYYQINSELFISKGDITSSEGMYYLRKSSNEMTKWSILFNLTTLELEAVFNKDYSNPYHINRDFWRE